MKPRNPLQYSKLAQAIAITTIGLGSAGSALGAACTNPVTMGVGACEINGSDSLSIESGGSIISSGSNALLVISSPFSGTIENSGTISLSLTTGSSGRALELAQGGSASATITNNGLISAEDTAGASVIVTAIHIRDFAGTLTNTANGTIQATGIGSPSSASVEVFAIKGSELTGTIDNNGTITASAGETGKTYADAIAYGIDLNSIKLDGKILNSGEIDVDALAEWATARATGIFVDNTMADNSVIENSGTIDIDANSNEGVATARGIFVNESSPEGALRDEALILNEGDITVSASSTYTARATGILVEEVIRHESQIVNRGDITATATTKIIGDNFIGAQAHGILVVDDDGYHGLQDRAKILNEGTLTVSATATQTGRARATGIEVEESINDQGYISNSGSISVSALVDEFSGTATAVGINVREIDEDAAIHNSGEIFAEATSYNGDAEAVGILVGYYTISKNSIFGGDINTNGEVINSGLINVSAIAGPTITAVAKGIELLGDMDDHALVQNTGVISVTAGDGTNFDVDAYGIRVAGELDDFAEIDNQGDIELSAYADMNINAVGIHIGTLADEAKITNTGSIEIFASVDSGYGEVLGIHVTTNSSVELGGDSYSMKSYSQILNAGTIEIHAEGSGTYSQGLDVQGILLEDDMRQYAQISNTALIDITASNQGDIYAVGIGVEDIHEYSKIHNTNTISVTATSTGGDVDAYGIELDGSLIDFGSVLNDGDIIVRAEASDYSATATAKGIYVDNSLQDSSRIINNGVVSAMAVGDTANAYGIHIYEAIESDASIINNGILSAQAMGTNVDEYGIYVYSGGSGSIENSGTIYGAIYDENDDEILVINTGRWYAPSVTNSYISNNYTQSGNGRLYIGIMGDTSGEYSQVEVDDDADLPTLSVRVWDRNGTFTLEDGDTLNDVFTADFYVNRPMDGTCAGGSAIWCLEIVDDGDNIDLVASYLGAANVAENAYKGLGGVVDGWMTDPNNQTDDITLLLMGLNNAENPDEFNTRLAQLTPRMAAEVGQLQQQIGHQVNEILVNPEALGMPAGDGYQGNYGAWVKPYYINVDQDQASNGAWGYDADTTGVMVGMDSKVGDNWRLGVALGYSDTDLEGDQGLSGDSLDSEGYQFSVYGHGDLSDRLYVDLIGTYGFADNDVERQVTFLSEPWTGKGSFDSWFTRLHGQVGYQYDLNACWTLTPELGLTWTHLDQDGYREKGGRDWVLDVDSMDDDILTASLDLGANYKAMVGELPMSFGAYVGAGYDIIDADADLSANMIGAGPVFSTEGAEIDELSLRTGAAMRTAIADTVDLTLAYDAEFRDERVAQGVSANIRWSF